MYNAWISIPRYKTTEPNLAPNQSQALSLHNHDLSSQQRYCSYNKDIKTLRKTIVSNLIDLTIQGFQNHG